MKKVMILAAGLILIAGCSSTNERNSGSSDVMSPGISGGATGTPSGTSGDPLGAANGPATPTGTGVNHDTAPPAR